MQTYTARYRLLITRMTRTNGGEIVRHRLVHCRIFPCVNLLLQTAGFEQASDGNSAVVSEGGRFSSHDYDARSDSPMPREPAPRFPLDV